MRKCVFRTRGRNCAAPTTAAFLYCDAHGTIVARSEHPASPRPAQSNGIIAVARHIIDGALSVSIPSLDGDELLRVRWRMLTTTRVSRKKAVPPIVR